MVRQRGRPRTPPASYEAKHGDYNTVLKFRTQQAERVFPRREPHPGWRSTAALPASGLAVYHCDILGSNELPAGHGGEALPVRAAAGRRPPRPRAERQPGRRQRPVRRDRRHRAVGHVVAAHSREWDGRDSGPRDLRHHALRAPTITFSVGAASRRRRWLPARRADGCRSPTTRPQAFQHDPDRRSPAPSRRSR